MIWRHPRLLALLGIFIGAVVGFGLSCAVNRPGQAWLQWAWLSAGYEAGAHRIVLIGQYHVNRECLGEVLWRTEATATDGQIAAYGPTEEPPDLTPGIHQYLGQIALLATILPDGWTARVIVTCAGDPDAVPPTIASASARVIMDPAWQRRSP